MILVARTLPSLLDLAHLHNQLVLFLVHLQTKKLFYLPPARLQKNKVDAQFNNLIILEEIRGMQIASEYWEKM